MPRELQDGGPPKLTIGMPARNEERRIGLCVRRALESLNSLQQPGEVLLIDDGSTDRTSEVAVEAAGNDDRLRILRNRANLGIAGFSRQILSEARGEWVFYISADGEFDFADGPRFVEIAGQEDLDAVQGFRVAKRYSIYRHVVSWSFRALPRLLFGSGFADAGCVRLLRREAFVGLKLYSQSAFINAERLLVAQRLGLRIGEAPVQHYPRLSGKGRGSQPTKVLQALRDLLLTRLRWFRFEHYYGQPRKAGGMGDAI